MIRFKISDALQYNIVAGYVIEFLISQNDPTVLKMIDNIRIHLMPSMNPDGYERAAQQRVS